MSWTVTLLGFRTSKAVRGRSVCGRGRCPDRWSAAGGARRCVRCLRWAGLVGASAPLSTCRRAGCPCNFGAARSPSAVPRLEKREQAEGHESRRHRGEQNLPNGCAGIVRSAVQSRHLLRVEGQRRVAQQSWRCIRPDPIAQQTTMSGGAILIRARDPERHGRNRGGSPPRRWTAGQAFASILFILVPHTGQPPFAIRRPFVSATSPWKSRFSLHFTQYPLTSRLSFNPSVGATRHDHHRPVHH